ncbi:MAG: heavy metal-binding domain-containing protein [Peptococcaceae bacterium]|nr:heavy metal-binding domain-containing protein [Peptococcaceae bacterium]
MTSTQTISQCAYEELGLVRAASVHSKNIAKDIGQSLKSVVGGELKGYTDLLEATVEAVTAKLEMKAEVLGADAVIAIGYTTSNVTEYGTEVIGWGTAVKFV